MKNSIKKITVLALLVTAQVGVINSMDDMGPRMRPIPGVVSPVGSPLGASTPSRSTQQGAQRAVKAKETRLDGQSAAPKWSLRERLSNREQRLADYEKWAQEVNADLIRRGEINDRKVAARKAANKDGNPFAGVGLFYPGVKEGAKPADISYIKREDRHLGKQAPEKKSRFGRKHAIAGGVSAAALTALLYDLFGRERSFVKDKWSRLKNWVSGSEEAAPAA